MTNVSLNVSCSTKYELVTRAGAEDLEILTRTRGGRSRGPE